MTWGERWGAWTERHRFAIDAAGAALLALVMAPTSEAVMGLGPTGSGWVTLAMVAPLAWRRVRPTASVAAVYAIGLVRVLAGHPLVPPADVAVLVALYSVTVYGPRWAHRVAIAGALAGSALAVVTLALGPGFGLVEVVTMLGFLWAIALAVWALALVRRARVETLTALRDRAARLEVERDQQALLGAAAERARIAREMHDIVAHSLSVVVAQADGGRYAAQADPEAATRALGTIAETGRAALADMRRLLGVLREDAGGGGTGAAGGVDAGRAGAPGGRGPGTGGAGTPPDGVRAASTPQPAEHDLDALVEQVRASGLRVSLLRMGSPRPLPPGLGLTVYRICQEALTNVLKHAGPDPSVTVMVQWRADAIAIEVSDDGRGAAAASDGLGHGLVGMRERASVFGGALQAGPRAGGGYRVRAVLPLPGGLSGAGPGEAPGDDTPADPTASADPEATAG